MSVPRKVVTPEAVAMARHLYEQTNVPLRDIAVLLGVGMTTLVQRVKQWGWAPRSARMPTASPPAPVTPAAGWLPAEDGAGREPPSRGALIARLIARIEAEMSNVERLLAQAGGNEGLAGNERAARTLAILVRSLRELAALDKLEPDGSDDDADRDADAFRRELGRTLERVLAGGPAS